MKKAILVVFLLILFFPSVCSWSVDPAKWTIYMYEDRMITPQHLVIRVNNYHNSTLTVKFTVRNDAKLIYDEYETLPNTSWVELEDELVISPHTNYEMPVTVDVENTSENYNKKWQFFIFADQTTGGATNESSSTNFQYDYNLRWSIITPPEYMPKKQQMEFPWIWIILSLGLILGLSLVVICIKKNRDRMLKEDMFAKR